MMEDNKEGSNYNTASKEVNSTLTMCSQYIGQYTKSIYKVNIKNQCIAYHHHRPSPPLTSAGSSLRPPSFFGVRCPSSGLFPLFLQVGGCFKVDLTGHRWKEGIMIINHHVVVNEMR